MDNLSENILPLVFKLEDGSLVFVGDDKGLRSFDNGSSWGDIGHLSGGTVMTSPRLSKEEILSLKSEGKLPQ